MNPFRTLAASLVLLSTVGCYCMDPYGPACCGTHDGYSSPYQPYGANNCVCDAGDDAYGYDMGEPACTCGQCNRGPKRGRRPRMVSRRGPYQGSYAAMGCCEPMCCSTCGYDNEWSDGAVSSGSSCGCGQSSHMMYHPGSTTAPTPTYVPPAAVPPANAPSGNEPEPASSGTTFRHPYGTQPQMVSYEEFQRLPGTVVSGPGITTESQPNSPASYSQLPPSMAPAPRTANVPSKMTVRPAGLLPPSNVASQTQQAVWVPAK